MGSVPREIEEWALASTGIELELPDRFSIPVEFLGARTVEIARKRGAMIAYAFGERFFSLTILPGRARIEDSVDTEFSARGQDIFSGPVGSYRWLAWSDGRAGYIMMGDNNDFATMSALAGEIVASLDNPLGESNAG